MMGKFLLVLGVAVFGLPTWVERDRTERIAEDVADENNLKAVFLSTVTSREMNCIARTK